MDSEQAVSPADARSETTHSTIKGLLLAGASAFVAINVWTGAPIAALWVGSAAIGQRELSMAAVFVVVIVLAVLELSLVLVLMRLNSAHDRLTGRKTGEQRLTWLYSMNTQGQENRRSGIAMSTPEKVVVASVYITVIGLIGWFFLIAGSPLAG